MVAHQSSDPVNRFASTAPGLLCLGEIGWDRLWVLNSLPRKEGDCHLLSQKEGPGGCALNTACVLAGFGLPVTLAGNLIGHDREGNELLKYLAAHGVSHRLVQKPTIATPFCQVLVEQDSGKRQFILSYRDIQLFDQAQIAGLVEETRQGRFSQVFVQPFVREVSMQYLLGVQEIPGVWIMTQDVQPDSPFVPLVDAIQVSLQDEEAFTLEAAWEQAKPYFQGRPSVIFVTAGGRGVAVCHANGQVELHSGFPVQQVVDTTGCGDAFRAGVMWGLFSGRSLQEAVRWGQKAGAYKATVYGSHFFKRLEVESR